MLEILILSAVLVLGVLSLGLPLLLGPNSRIPDYLGFTVLATALLYFAWSLDAWWMLPAAATIVAFVAWLDRKAPEPAAAARPRDERGWSPRTRLRFRLWRAAHLAGVALIVGVVIVVATGSPFLSATVTFLVGALFLSVVASSIFRFSFCNAVERDRHALAGADGVGDRGPQAGGNHASSAPLG